MVLAAARTLRDALAGFSVDGVSGADCAVVAEELAAAVNACSAAWAVASVRAGEAGAHRARGHHGVRDWVASMGGCSVGEGRRVLDVGKGFGSCHATRAAALEGSVSLDQAAIIVGCEDVCAGSEADLLALARTSDLASLRSEAIRRRLAAVPPDELADRQRRSRGIRHWNDEEGMVRWSGALPPAAGVAVANRLEAEAERLRRKARAELADGEKVEPFAAYMADALESLVCGTESGSGRRRADVVFVCDLGAYRRGWAEAGEACHVIRGGPVPVSEVRAAFDDAFVKAVLYHGTQIDTVAHFGRHIPAHVRTAIELGDPPGFRGPVCSVPGCGRTLGLEIDHLDPVANGGATTLRNLRFKCWGDHQEKTERDRAEGRLGRAGGRRAPP